MAYKLLTGAHLNNKQITNLADGSAATDAITKQQLDAAIRGLDWKPEVMAASTANVTIATPGTSLDGYTLVANDRVLLKDQTAPADNGIYVWTASGAALTRALDADSAAELSGSTTTVQRGTINADRVYRVTADDPITLGTTAITFVQVGAGSTPYTAGNGLTLSGNDFNVGVTAGLSVVADSVGIDTAVVARKFAANCAATTNPQSFAHGLATGDLHVTIKEGNIVVHADVTIDATNVTVDFGAAPTASQFRVIAVG